MKSNKIIQLLMVILAVMCISCGSYKKDLTLNVINTSSLDRNNEIIEIAWDEITQKLSLIADQKIIVTDIKGRQIPYQLITNGSDKVETLIFPVTLAAGDSTIFKISVGDPITIQSLVYGRLVPERKDDFAWENNRTAFRIYGPALKATGEISNGMDFWAKKTDSLIIDKWYKNDLSGVASYHEDHGEGLDFYKVGRTLGLGMTAPVDNDSLCLGDNFVTADILDNGPLRLTFKLTYDPYIAVEHMITETRIISLDANSFFNKVTNIFETDTVELTVATGIVMTPDKPEITFGHNSGIIAYETPGNDTNGIIYTAVINPNGFGMINVSDGHYLGLNNYQTGTPYTYYTGAGWSKAGFDSFEEWTQFVQSEKVKKEQPLVVKID